MLRKSLTILTALTVLAAPALEAQDRTTVAVAPSVVKSLPSATSLLLRVPSVSRLVRKIERSPVAEIAKRDDFAEMFTQFKDMLEQGRQEAIAETKVDPVAMLEAIQGELVITLGDVTPLIQLAGGMLVGEEPEITSEMVPFMISVDTGAGFPTFKENLQSLFAFIIREGASLKTDKFHGGRITTLTPPEGEEEIEAIYVGEHGTRFLFGTSKKTIEQTMVGLGGGDVDSPLPKDKMFRTTNRLAGKGSDLFVYVNLRPTLTAINEIMAANPFGLYWKAAEEIIFGQSFNNFAIGYDLENEGMRGRMFVHNEGAEDGLLGWFKGDPLRAG